MAADVVFCAQCGRSSTAEAAFCAACGAELQAAYPAPRTERLTGQRRNVTIMMSDLSGYTAMGERLDPEVVQDVMGTIKRDATAIVESHGGIVNQFIGDEIVALFGLPTASEDDPRRAVHAALAIHARVAELSHELEASLDAPLTMHTGIHSGLLVAQLSDLRNGTYELTGDAINTAARLLGVAGDQELIIGEPTMAAVAPFFETEFAGHHQVRNKAALLTAHRVLRPRAHITRFDVARERGLTTFAGRDDELRRLDETLARARRAEPQITVVAGPAGSGKSRLCYEFLDWARTEDPRLRTVKGRCQAFGGSTAYLPFVEILRAQFGIDDRADLETAEALVHVGLESLGDEVRRFTPAYLYLLSVRSLDQLPGQWRGEELANHLQTAILEFLLALGSEQPTVVQLEDWHWADDASRSTLRRLTASLATAHLMLLVTTRPQDTELVAWGPDDVLHLETLGMAATSEMVCAIAGSRSADEELVSVIFERTHGNPFFVEELCASLESQGRTRLIDGHLELLGGPDELTVPETVQAVVLGRVDSLEPHQRDLLRTASVIGREFRTDVLSALVDDPELDTHLDELARLGFIEVMFGASHDRMRFRHVIIQEVTYDSLLIGSRRRLHARVAEFIEDSQSIEDAQTLRNVEELAHHYRLADDPANAVKFLGAAGEKATAQRALAEARTLLSLAMSETYKLEQTIEVRAQRGRLTLSWARSCVFKPSVDQIDALVMTRDEAIEDGNYGLALLAVYWTSWIHHSIGNQLMAEDSIRSLLDPLEAAGELSTLAMARCHLAQILTTQRRLTEALDEFEAGLSVRRAEMQTEEGEWDLERVDGVYCYTVSQHALVLGDVGDVTGARAGMDTAIELTNLTSESATAASTLIVAAILETYVGDWALMLERIRRIDALPEPSVSPFVRMFALSLEGYARFRLGERDRGLALMRRSVALNGESEAQLAHSLRLALLADALLRMGDLDEAASIARAAIDRLELGDAVGVDLADRVLLQCEGLTGAALDDRIAGVRKDAIDRGSRRSLAMAELAAGAARLAVGDHDGAAAHHAAAAELVAELDLDGFLDDVEELRAQIELHTAPTESSTRWPRSTTPLPRPAR